MFHRMFLNALDEQLYMYANKVVHHDKLILRRFSSVGQFETFIMTRGGNLSVKIMSNKLKPTAFGF
jgi:hypothetical protein